MDDAQVPAAERATKFHLCLEGDACDWYNDATIPADWDELMTMFCQHFCVFGQTEEDWHEAWNRLSFNKTTDNIDKFISKVKWLVCQLRFRDHSILIKLKQLFPEKEDTWLVVHDLEEMCGYLNVYILLTTSNRMTWHKALFSRNRAPPLTPSQPL